MSKKARGTRRTGGETPRPRPESARRSRTGGLVGSLLSPGGGTSRSRPASAKKSASAAKKPSPGEVSRSRALRIAVEKGRRRESLFSPKASAGRESFGGLGGASRSIRRSATGRAGAGSLGGVRVLEVPADDLNAISLIERIPPGQLVNIISSIEDDFSSLREEYEGGGGVAMAAVASRASGRRSVAAEVPVSLEIFSRIIAGVKELQGREERDLEEDEGMAAAAEVEGEGRRYDSSLDLRADLVRFCEVMESRGDSAFPGIEGLILNAITRQIEVTRIADSRGASASRVFSPSRAEVVDSATKSGRRMEDIQGISNPTAKQKAFIRAYFSGKTEVLGAALALKEGVGAGAIVKALDNLREGMKIRDGRGVNYDDGSVIRVGESSTFELCDILESRILEYKEGRPDVIVSPNLATVFRTNVNSDPKAKDILVNAISFLQQLALLDDKIVTRNYRIEPPLGGSITEEDSASIITYHLFWTKLLAIELVDLCRVDVLLPDMAAGIFGRHKEIYENLGLGKKTVFLPGKLVKVEDFELRDTRHFPFASAVHRLRHNVSSLEGKAVRGLIRRRIDEGVRGVLVDSELLREDEGRAMASGTPARDETRWGAASSGLGGSARGPGLKLDDLGRETPGGVGSRRGRLRALDAAARTSRDTGNSISLSALVDELSAHRESLRSQPRTSHSADVGEEGGEGSPDFKDIRRLRARILAASRTPHSGDSSRAVGVATSGLGSRRGRSRASDAVDAEASSGHLVLDSRSGAASGLGRDDEEVADSYKFDEIAAEYIALKERDKAFYSWVRDVRDSSSWYKNLLVSDSFSSPDPFSPSSGNNIKLIRIIQPVLFGKGDHARISTASVDEKRVSDIVVVSDVYNPTNDISVLRGNIRFALAAILNDSVRDAIEQVKEEAEAEAAVEELSLNRAGVIAALEARRLDESVALSDNMLVCLEIIDEGFPELCKRCGIFNGNISEGLTPDRVPIDSIFRSMTRDLSARIVADLTTRVETFREGGSVDRLLNLVADTREYRLESLEDPKRFFVESHAAAADLAPVRGAAGSGGGLPRSSPSLDEEDRAAEVTAAVAAAIAAEGDSRSSPATAVKAQGGARAGIADRGRGGSRD